jgi:DNA polymerase III subunit epsilon
MQFMDGGIFVAHGVNFDYGFISYEHERLGRRFRFEALHLRGNAAPFSCGSG